MHSTDITMGDIAWNAAQTQGQQIREMAAEMARLNARVHALENVVGRLMDLVEKITEAK